MVNQELEHYLSRLERSLGPIAISEKAEILTEIKSHVMDAIDSDEDKSMRQILLSLGEPEQVANKYLIERGLKPQKPPKHPVIKWLTIGFLGTFAISVFTLLILIWNFSPLINVDEDRGRVQILGGLIDIQQKEKENSFFQHRTFSKTDISGEEDLRLSTVKKIQIAFANGKLSIKNSTKSKFKYNCKIGGPNTSVRPTQTKELLELNLNNTSSSHCILELPAHIALVIDGNNGNVNMQELKNNISVNIMNGKIGFSPDANSEYKFQASVMNGKMDQFMNSKSKKAFNVKLSLMNGKIRNL